MKPQAKRLPVVAAADMGHFERIFIACEQRLDVEPLDASDLGKIGNLTKPGLFLEPVGEAGPV